MFEVVFRVRSDSFYSDVTQRYPSTKMHTWCNNNNDIVEVFVGKKEEYGEVIEEIRSHDINELLEESSDTQKIHLMVKQCTCDIEQSIWKHMGDLHILKIQPTVVEDGWEYHRTVIFRHEDFDSFINVLDNHGFVVEVIRKAPYDGLIASSLTITSDTLLSGLTERQVNAMLTAHKYGYYKLPRVTDIQTISSKESVARTTFQEHLKKAENKVVDALVPYLTLFKLNTPKQRRRLIIK